MKGIIMSAVLWILLMIMIGSMIWLFNFEHTRNQVVRAHKQSLRSTMNICINMSCDSKTAFNLFGEYFSTSVNQYDEASWHLMGFNHNPLLIRVSVNVKNMSSYFPIFITSDETMIQEIDYE